MDGGTKGGSDDLKRRRAARRTTIPAGTFGASIWRLCGGRRMLGVLAWLALLSGWPGTPLWAQVVDRMGNNNFATAQRPVTLKDVLAKELRARRPREFDFINTVVQMVDQGKLPLRMVRSSFLWARHKRPYPLVYFEQSLKRQASAAGIVIPASVLVR